MAKLDELIQELCPNGVEYKTLGEISEIKGRIGFRGYTRADQVDKGNGAISLSPSNIIDGDIDFETCTYISWSKYDESPEIMVSKGDIIFCKTASVGKTALVKHLPEKATINPQLVLIKNIKCNSAYLSYVLKTPHFQSQVYKIKGLGTIPTISQKDFQELSVPVPPLEVQCEIVRILDNFTLLTAELTAELTARKKQYEYYRDELLTFDDTVPIVKIKDVCKNVSSGGTPSTSNRSYYCGNIPWLRTQEVDWKDITGTELKITEEAVNNSSAKWIPANCIIVAMYGATAGKVAINKIPLTTNQACCNLEVDEDKVLYRYVFHWLYKEYLPLKSLGQGSQSNINGNTVKNYPIPLPPIAEQERIVSILDRFDALCNDISIGLPAEIEARQKQYEYYRDKLLTFKEKTA